MNIRMSVIAALVLGVSAILSGCSKGADDTVIAKVNRTAITAVDFKKQIEELTPQMQQAVIADPKARKEFLEDLIGIELVIQEARRMGLDKEAEFKKRQDMLRKELERRVQEDAKNELFNSVLKKELGDKMGKITPPTDQEARDYYNQNKDKISKAAGKQLAYKEIEQQLKNRMVQEKRREVYLEYARGLKAKSKISVDDKALDTAIAELAQPKDVDLSNIKVQPAPGKKEDTKK